MYICQEDIKSVLRFILKEAFSNKPMEVHENLMAIGINVYQTSLLEKSFTYTA